MFAQFMKITARQLLLLVLLPVLSVSIGLAQDASDRNLTPGQALSGILDAESVAQVYTFSAAAGDLVDIALTSPDGIALAAHVSDAGGIPLTQAIDDAASGSLTLPEISIAEDGTYYVTVFATPGFEDAASISFEIVLTAAAVVDTPAVTAVVQPGSVITTSGLRVTLSWDASVDLNLEVRDPVGGTLYWDSREASSGGSFGFDANGLCETLSDVPTETATWPSGAIPSGSYEILVFYRQSCEFSGPANFTVDVSVDGTDLNSIEGSLSAPTQGQEQVYAASFVVNADGTATLGPSGIYAGALLTPIQSLPDPTTLTVNELVQDAITGQQPYKTYALDALANDIVSVAMSATSGSLDTLLYFLDPNGNVISFNDDEDSFSRNSAIRDLPLFSDGQYTIVATRYAESVGGTEGDFRLLVSTSSQPQELALLDLPRGDIEISLVWDTGADLQLLVRDPAGDSVYDDTPTIPSGGRLGATGNINCNPAPTRPISYIYWPPGFQRGGSYEIEVWYQDPCDDQSPVDFTLNVAVRGESVLSERIRPLPNQKYVTNFRIEADGSVVAGSGGIVGGSETLDYRTTAPLADTITSGQLVTGSITTVEPFKLYTFEGQSGEVATIRMRTTAGALDSTLFLISPTGFEIAFNDDAVVGETTDSLISEFVLPDDGQYFVIATRYGTVYGGTEGRYELALQLN